MKRLACAGLTLAVFASTVTWAQSRTETAVFLDATDTHVPQAPTLHALDAAIVHVDRDGDLHVVGAV